MNNTDKLKAIEKQMSDLRLAQMRLEADNFKNELAPKITSHIGKTFAYRKNCYSCPSDPSDYWDVFRRLVKVSFDEYHAWVTFQEVQIDSAGIPQITLAVDLISSRDAFPKLETGWKPCLVAEFDAAYNLAMDEFNTQKQCAEHIEARK